ncbi:MAG: sigma-54 dependent transcriptional regulator [Desulfobacterales bacterium]|nr:sigma-54 dependent transcriptional regulator [Desulfobacterales bacterium]
MKQGAFDYISDEDNPDDIIAALKQAVEVSDKDKTRQNSRLNVSNIVGESSGIKQVFKTVGRVSVTDTTVLITGESGTGKELIARAIHASSGRHNKPMIVINCGAIPGELLESELFGHEKGAFTGAHRTRIGRFELADGGTIFLDEIGDMSSDLQVKLLRVLQEQNFERVGGTRSLNVDVRILAATNKNLRNAIKEGSFREDLYYRLNVIPIHVPPLRERRSDIPLLVDFFQKRLSDRIGEPQKSFSDESINKLVRYEWPGNIRELENLMERVAVLVEESVVEVSDLPERIRGGVISGQPSATISFEDGQSFSDLIEQFQKNLIIQALNQTNWVKAKASTLLKMNRTTLVEKIKKLNIEAPSSEEEHLEDILFR